MDWSALFKGDLGALVQALRQATESRSDARLPFLIAMIGILPFALVPITLLLLATATLLPPGQAFFAIMAGTLLNTAMGYATGQAFGRGFLAFFRLDRFSFMETLKSGAKEHGFKMALLSRFLPVPFIFASAASPVIGLRFWQIFSGTFLVMLPWAVFYVFFTESLRQGSLRMLGPALGILALIVTGLALARRRLMQASSEPLPQGLLLPQSPPLGPELTLYSLPGHEACEDARRELWALRPKLKFEVRELDLSASPELDSQFHDHAPVVFLGKRKLFSFQVDENALELYLRQNSRD